MSKLKNSIAALGLAAAALTSNGGAQAQSTNQTDLTRGAVNAGLIAGDPMAQNPYFQNQQAKNGNIAALAGISRMNIRAADGTVIRGGIEFRNTGAIGQFEVGKELFENFAIVARVEGGSKHQGMLLSMGFQVAENNYLVLTHQKLRELLSFQFTSQEQSGWLSQVTTAASWTWVNPKKDDLFQYGKASVYKTDSDSRSFGMEQYSTETTALYELFQKEMRVAGVSIQGAEASTGVRASEKVTLHGGIGTQNRKDNTLVDTGSKSSPTAKLGLEYKVNPNMSIIGGVAGSSFETRTSVGIMGRTEGGLNVGVQAYHSNPKDSGQKTSTGVMFQLSGNFNLDGFNPGGKQTSKSTPARASVSPIAAPTVSDTTQKPEYYSQLPNGTYSVSASDYAKHGGVIPDVQSTGPESFGSATPALGVSGTLPFMRPKTLLDATFQAGAESYIPKQVYASVDTTVTPTRLVSIDKTALPTGASIDKLTGNIIVQSGLPLGAFVSAVNAANGQAIPASVFLVNGNTITIQTQALQPYLATGTNTLTVTTQNATVVIVAEKGSVIIKSVVVTPNAPSATADDTNNRIVLGSSIDSSLVEVNSGAGWVPYSASATYEGNVTVRVRIKALLGTIASGETVLNFTANAVAPGASGCTHDDTTNKIICPGGVNPSTIEVSFDQVTWTAFNANTTYVGNKTVYERVKAQGANPAGAVTRHDFTNSAPVITSGSSVAASFTTGTGGTVPAMTVADADGDSLVYALIGAPAGVTVDASGVISVAASVGVGTYTFSRTASDGQLSATQSVQITVSAIPVDSTPDAFDITNLTAQARNTVVTTNAITVAGINTSVTATTTLGTIVKNGTDTGLASTTVSAGDTVAVKLTTSSNYSTTQNGTLTIGGVADTFDVTTVASTAPTAAPGSFAISTGALTNNQRPTLSWSAVSGATSYEVQTNGGGWTDIGNVTSYQVPTLGEGNYTFVVRAKNADGSGPQTGSVSTQIDITPPSVTADNLNGIDNSYGAGSGTITFSKNIASASGLKMVFTGTNTQYTNAVVTGTLSGGVLTVNYTDAAPIGTTVDII